MQIRAGGMGGGFPRVAGASEGECKTGENGRRACLPWAFERLQRASSLVGVGIEMFGVLVGVEFGEWALVVERIEKRIEVYASYRI